jgi:cytochrome oxidase Cu insertion factor (SCO1/SenC/PrrC family)
MAAAATNPNADPILAESAYGRPELTNIPTPAFSLVDQDGRRVSIASLHGKTVALTFFDSTCTHAAGGCATVQELRLVDRVLGTMADRVELVAINTNSAYQRPGDLASFDRRAGLDRVSNWMYLTGPLSQLRDVLSGFAIHVSGPQGYKYMSMGLPHGQTAYVIDGSGVTREVLTTGDRGSESKVMTSSVAVALANAVEQVAG